jgi:hypothetical protein
MPRAKPHQRPPDLPHTLLSAIGQQWSRPCRPAESGLASRGMGGLVFCPAKPSSNRFGVNSSWGSRPVGLALRKRVSRIARTQHIGFGSVPKGLLASSSELLPFHGLGEAPPDLIAYLPKATTQSASPPGALAGSRINSSASGSIYGRSHA